MIRLITATATLAIITACATDYESAPEAASSEPTTTVLEFEPNQFELAMNTVDQLLMAGNPQTAIDRLTQLLGDPDLLTEDKAATLLRRGEIRYSEKGYDVWGAISDFEETIVTSPGGYLADDAEPRLDIARGEATSLSFALETEPLSRIERFNARFRLGEHQEAVDLMQANNLTPDNSHLIAMYQIGYLCEGDELAGPAYTATEPDGTARNL